MSRPPLYVGVDLGGTNLAAGLVDADGALLARVSYPIPSGADDRALVSLMASAAADAADAGDAARADIASVGLGIPGLLDPENGVVFYACNLPLRYTPARALFREIWDIPVFMENDAGCAALGELRCGAARRCAGGVLLLTLGTGIGGAYLENGKLLTGCNGGALEVGHMVVAAGGQPCPCGRRGCWEQYASANGLKRLTREEMERQPKSLLWDLAEGRLSGVGGRTAFQAAKAGDEAGKRVVALYLDYLAAGIVNLINIFQPERLLLGGGVANEEDSALLRPLRERVERERCTRDGPQTELNKAALGNDAGIIGAALLGTDGCAVPPVMGTDCG